MYDLVVRGGRVVDPAQGLDAVLDVAIDGDRSRRWAGPGRRRRPRGGRGRRPDRHARPGRPAHPRLLGRARRSASSPTPTACARGVTTAVDAGSSGASTFPAFRRYVIDVSATRIVAMLHISTIGMARDDGSPRRGDRRARGHPLGERRPRDRGRAGPRRHDRRHQGARSSRPGRPRRRAVPRGAAPRPPGRRGDRQAGDGPRRRHRHPARRDPRPRSAAATSSPTCYHGRSRGRARRARQRSRLGARAAVERGIGFDVGHGAGSFSCGSRPPAWPGLQPGTISSDIHTWNVAGPVFDLATTASKLLHLGLPLGG